MSSTDLPLLWWAGPDETCEIARLRFSNVKNWNVRRNPLRSTYRVELTVAPTILASCHQPAHDPSEKITATPM